MPYVPRNLRVEFYCKVCKSLSQGSFSVCSFMNHTLYVRIKRDVCNSSHQIETIKEPSSDTTRWWVCKHATNLRIYLCLALITWKIPLKASWCFQTLNFQKTFALRICLWKIKVWDTLSSLNFFPRGRLIPCSQSKGGNSGIRKLIASFRIIVTHVILMYIYYLCVLLTVYMYMFYFLMYIQLMFFINTLLWSEFISVTYPFYVVLFKRTSRTETLNTLYMYFVCIW